MKNIAIIMRHSTPLLISLLLLLLSPLRATSQEIRSITIEGTATVKAGNTSLARDEALADALRKSIEQAVGELTSPSPDSRSLQQLDEKIYSQSNLYVKSYKIISDGADAEGIYRVAVIANIALDELSSQLDSLGLLIRKKGMPRILFMIAEQNIGQKYLIFWWNIWGDHKTEYIAEEGRMGISENVLSGKFIEKGFNIVDHSVQNRDIKIPSSIAIADLTDTAAITIGRKLDAEVVVYGRAVATLSGKVMGSGMYSSQANANAKAVIVDSGSVIGAASSSGAAIFSDELIAGSKALEKVGAELADKLIEQISAKWNKDVSRSQLVRLTVSGIGDYADFVRFKNALTSKVKGVQSIYQRSLSAETATVDIDMKGDAQNLADQIVMLDFEGFRPVIRKVSAGSIDMILFREEKK